MSVGEVAQPYVYAMYDTFVPSAYEAHPLTVVMDADAPFLARGISIWLRQRRKAKAPSFVKVHFQDLGTYFETDRNGRYQSRLWPGVRFKAGSTVTATVTFRPGSKLGNFRPQIALELVGFKVWEKS